MSILTLVAVLGAGLVAGIFFAFSTFIMRALGRMPGNRGIAAMNAINVTVLNPWFFNAFFGTGLLCLAVAVLSWEHAAGVHRIFLLTGSGLYLFGCLAVTMAFNVPLNDRLAKVEPGDPEAGSLWAEYLARWTVWNHVRTAASLGAAGAFAAALAGV